MTTDALDALFRRLVLAARQADALARPLEVGELLDTLVPYRAARRDGLLDTNDDYLHCLMQLLAGERGYIFADDLLQDDLKNELTAINPDLGVLTTYRTAKVRIASAEAQRVLADDTVIDLRPPTPASIPTAPRGVSPVRGQPAQHTAPAESSALREHVAPAAALPVAPVAAPVAAPATDTPVSVPTQAEPETLDCPYCSQSLPSDRTLTYCPHCGLNLRIRRCPGCSAEMEAEWKFCVTCGRSAP